MIFDYIDFYIKCIFFMIMMNLYVNFIICFGDMLYGIIILVDLLGNYKYIGL